VDLAVDGVIISDLYPALMPDIFSGEQLVVAGRYDGWGPATVSLTGRIRGEHVTIEYDDVRFSAAGGDDTVPSLWATRKIGDLLRDIRLNGPDAETIDQIVRISIRHGIVTPYTSYLVTEPAPFGDDAIDVISRGAADSMTTFAPSGEASVGAADAASELSDADRFAAPQTEYRDVVTTAGGRTMRQVEGVWIDTTYDPAMEVVRVAFASDDYFKLAASSSAIADALAIGQLVIVVLDGTAYEIVDIEAEADDLPTTVTSSTSTTPTTTPLVFGAGPEGDTDGGLSSAAIALMAALGAAATLAVLAARKN
jgi:Ca-activated chloride channel family protein